MNKLYIVLACFIFTQHAFSQTDCSELLTLSSTPASCNENGTITATVDGCSSSISGGGIWMDLYNVFDNPVAYDCIEYGYWMVCEQLGWGLGLENLSMSGISYEEFMNELLFAASGSEVMMALYNAFDNFYGYECIEYGMGCPEVGIFIGNSNLSYEVLMGELQDLAEGSENNNCTIMWTDDAGNNIGEEFTISDVDYGIYTATLTHSDGCIGIQEIEVDFVCEGCMDEEACNFLNTANVEDGSCIYIAEGECDCEGNVNDAIGVCGGNCVSDYNENGICDIDDIIGCTYENALNYEPTATIDNGSCVFEECPDCSDDCPGDLDGDYVVSTSDLLIFLSQFGAVCDNTGCDDADGDSICDDEDNCPFVANADQVDVNANGIGDACEGCLSNQDCDDGDSCTIDYCINGECISEMADNDGDGVFCVDDCNDGDSSIYPGAPEIIDGIDNDCDGLVDEVCSGGYADCNGDPSDGCETNLTNDINNCGACGAICTDDGDPNTYEYCQNGVCISCLDTNQNSICDDDEFSCGNPISFNNYDYTTIMIGGQCWFAENLRTEKYANGEQIDSNLSTSEWDNTSNGAVAVYGSMMSNCNDNSPDINACDPSESVLEYGRLYNWYAVSDNRSICPSGWHVPSEGDWIFMINNIGGEIVAGVKLKTTYGWYGNGNGTNEVGFNALPGGIIDSSGNSYGAGQDGNWWSSTDLMNNIAFSINVYWSTDEVDLLYHASKQTGLSVRCVQD